MSRRYGIILSFILACCAAGPSHSLAANGCSVEVFESNPNRAAEACSSILDKGEITSATRAEILKIRGRALHRMGWLDAAIGDYEAALQIAPDDPELHLRRGWTAFDKRDLDLVFDQAHRALELKPGYADVYGLVGAAFALGGSENFAKAKAAYDEAIRLDPQDPLFRFNRLILLKTNRLLREAIQEANAILQLPAPLITKPTTVNSYLKRTTIRVATKIERANLLTVVGRLDEAQKAYDDAIETDPNALTFAWRAAFRLSQIAFGPGSPPPSINAIQDDLDKAVALEPDYWFSRNQQAQLYFVREEYELAATEFARALKGYPINGAMRWKYALSLRKLGRGEEAASEAVAAFQLDPGFMANKAGVLRKRGYLAAIAPDSDPRPALMDAARACMLDEDCG